MKYFFSIYVYSIRNNIRNKISLNKNVTKTEIKWITTKSRITEQIMNKNWNRINQ